MVIRIIIFKFEIEDGFKINIDGKFFFMIKFRK